MYRWTSCVNKLTKNFTSKPVSTLCFSTCNILRTPKASPTLSYPKEYKRPIGAWGYSLLTVPVITFCLGTWQVKRRNWKLNLIKSLESKIHTPPIDFPDDLEELSHLEYRRVKLRGTFHHDQEMYISPRSVVIEGGDTGGGLISSGNSGSLVITPFTLADKELTILVNRGWVPRRQTLPHTRKDGQIEGEVELTAVVRHPERQAPFVHNNDPSSSFWNWRDVDAMAKKLNTVPVFVDAVAESTVPGGPLGGQTRVTLRNEHFSYILTWYSLSLVTSFLWYRRFIRGLPLL